MNASLVQELESTYTRRRCTDLGAAVTKMQVGATYF